MSNKMNKKCDSTRTRINENCELLQTLNEMYNLSYKMFLNSLNIHATRLLEKVIKNENMLVYNY